MSSLSNVTYPELVMDGTVKTGSGDRVIAMKVASDGKSWFRTWKSGWKECGGISTLTNGEKEIQFPVVFGYNNYSVVFLPKYSDTGGGLYYVNKLEGSIKFGQNGSPNIEFTYYCCGF